MTPRLALATLVLAVLLALAPTAAAEPDPVGVWPLVPEPEVVHGFDPPDDPWGAGHRGVDLLGAVGQPVRTALPGLVSWVGVLAGRGVVVVDHGGTRTTYEPVDATVELGATVSAGERIGMLDLAGSHCLPRACLHWGWLEGETYLDPLRIVGGGPVRLLPLWRIGDASADPMMVVERAARPRDEVATGVPRPGERHGAADPVITRVVLPYEHWQSALTVLRHARGWACW